MAFNIKKNKSLRNVLMLMTGTTFAQAITILVSPILTRLYSPEEFGAFAFFLSIVSILSIFSGGRYERAIILPDNDKDAKNLFALTVLLCAIFGLISFVFILIFGHAIDSFLSRPELSISLYLIPIAIVIMGTLKAYTFWFNRNKRYKDIMKNRVLQSSTTAITSTGYGLIGTSSAGLIMGYIVGQLAGVIRFFTKSRNEIQSSHISIEQIKKQAKAYDQFPKFSTLAHGTEATSSNLPNIVFTTFFNTTLVGYYSLVVRTISVPMSVIASAIGDVFLQRASREYSEKGSCRRLFIRTTFVLISISVIPFTLLFILAEDLFAFVFGEDWRLAGTYAKILIVPYFFQFISSPLSHMFNIAQKQKVELIIQTLVLALVTSALTIGNFVFHSFTTSLILLALALSIKYIIMYLYCYFFTERV